MDDKPAIPQLCPKCNGPMEQGFILDMGHGARFASQWARGTPLKSLLTGIWAPDFTLPVGAFRCTLCGYLESYARGEFASKPQRQFSLRALMIVVTFIAAVLGILAFIWKRNM